MLLESHKENFEKIFLVVEKKKNYVTRKRCYKRIFEKKMTLLPIDIFYNHCGISYDEYKAQISGDRFSIQYEIRLKRMR